MPYKVQPGVIGCAIRPAIAGRDRSLDVGAAVGVGIVAAMSHSMDGVGIVDGRVGDVTRGAGDVVAWKVDVPEVDRRLVGRHHRVDRRRARAPRSSPTKVVNYG